MLLHILVHTHIPDTRNMPWSPDAPQNWFTSPTRGSYRDALFACFFRPATLLLLLFLRGPPRPNFGACPEISPFAHLRVVGMRARCRARLIALAILRCLEVHGSRVMCMLRSRDQCEMIVVAGDRMTASLNYSKRILNEWML